MNIGIEINDKNFNQDIDLSEIEKGNPGMGGTEYVLLLLAYELSKIDGYHVTVFHFNGDIAMPPLLTSFVLSEDLREIKDSNTEIYILTCTEKPKDYYDFFDMNHISVIIHLDIYPQRDRVLAYRNIKCIKRFCFLGNEEYDRYIDDDIIEKGCIIQNLQVSTDENKARNTDMLSNNVVYTGAIVPHKGFHVLAKEWKNIVSEVPDAHLYVIGSGKLYNHSAELGGYGLAKPEYECQFIPYLTDENGKVLPSVSFLGVVDIDKKNEILKQAKVGVVNPTGATEVFCGSALEMSIFRIPVVTYAGYGQFDVVKNGITGYLIKNSEQLREKIIKLLKDNALNIKMGVQGKLFVEEFESDNIIPKWIKVFEEIANNEDAKYLGWHGNPLNNHKWFNIVNRFFRMKLKMRFLKSRMTR